MSKKEMIREFLGKLEDNPGLCVKFDIAMDDVGRIKKFLDETELSDDDLKGVSGGAQSDVESELLHQAVELMRRIMFLAIIYFIFGKIYQCNRNICEISFCKWLH